MTPAQLVAIAVPLAGSALSLSWAPMAAAVLALVAVVAFVVVCARLEAARRPLERVGEADLQGDAEAAEDAGSQR